ncbi:transposase [Nonomuraea phyllanthi]|uniref:transposase n=1 Tax=Nonomuraea phyllanthi TaxID=2219224 RepID=UPI00222084D1|nr:transposase [Nonomuraea phyllanthi]
MRSSLTRCPPFLNFDTEIRRMICSTNAIESVNARIRRAVKARGHFPNEQAALTCVYMAITSRDPTGKGREHWITRWKAALNAFAITFEGRPTPDHPITNQDPDTPFIQTDLLLD